MVIMKKKYFTLEEANSLLPTIEQELVSLQSLKQKFDQKRAQLEQYKKEFPKNSKHKGGEDPFFTLEAELDFFEIEAQSHLSNIEVMGALLKDIDMGLIDFPAMWDGEEVELCWKLGEGSISYYHGVSEGFMGRKPIKKK
jgi:hypothetical protein